MQDILDVLHLLHTLVLALSRSGIAGTEYLLRVFGHHKRPKLSLNEVEIEVPLELMIAQQPRQ